ncbi:sensor histidine kinase [Planococcus lenghuensis]|uniref:histidine kinase n=1 Tax=Planococcus lenghuensis TaxID=2213202 RepID=A0A1Q2KWP8_9BACL|nr:sensor histidine kinase [Planococcus lenghuensis]AQQ52573.1 sensor histidine kinase [Planococcus lenghuensis]
MIRLFFREHAAFIIFEFLLVVFILLLFWLDGFRRADTFSYVFIISTVLIATFLLAKFVRRYTFYKRVLHKPDTMEKALERNAKTPEFLEAERYLHDLYKLYQDEVQALYATQSRQIRFMNQWVHQMKTPLAVLEMLLQEEGELDKRSMREELDRMKAGLETVLMNARIETFEEDMQIDQVQLQALVQETISENKRLFISKRVYPVIDVPADFIVTTDRKWMKFTIGQFLTNAVKYTFEPERKVFVTANCREGDILLTVKDEGIGIPASDLARIRRPFFTGENGRKTGESTGMGLYLADEVCKKLGHQLDISSSPGEGTAISVLFHQQEQASKE